MSGFGRFLADNKIWWITPIVVVLLAVAFVLYLNASDDGGANSAFVYDMH
jgi:hypothetical protein